MATQARNTHVYIERDIQKLPNRNEEGDRVWPKRGENKSGDAGKGESAH